MINQTLTASRSSEMSSQSDTQVAPASPSIIWVGRVLSALPLLFLLFDGSIKLMNIAPVVDAFTHLGIPTRLAGSIGILELLCAIIYLVPRTSLLGAILLTGFLGGATAIHVRSDTPFYMPLVIGSLIWAGLLLRDARLRNRILLGE